MPTTLGQEIKAFGTTIHYDVESVERKGAVSVFQVTNLRGAAIGTEIAADPNFTQVVVQELSEVPGFARTLTDDLTKASSSTASMLLMSGILRRGPLTVSEACNELRLFASGPCGGLPETSLPPMSPGSSIMPGEMNPVIPGVMNM